MASSKSRVSARVRTAPAPNSSRRSTKSRIATRGPSSPLVFGLVTSGEQEVRAKVGPFLRWMGKHAGFEIDLREAASYEDLAAHVRAKRVDLAWLPPIVHVRLSAEVVPLGSILRDGRVSYEAALVVRKDAKARAVEGLRGMRAGWVDRWSAAGFVLPRINLALLGIDPRTYFRSETFHGSHRAVVRALMDGACDVVGTYAQADKKGKVRGGAWAEVPGADVRVIATFGAIPPDVIATRRSLDELTSTSLRDALRAASADEQGKRLLAGVFNGETFVEDMTKSYESLARALDMATARGLFT